VLLLPLKLAAHLVKTVRSELIETNRLSVEAALAGEELSVAAPACAKHSVLTGGIRQVS